MNSNQVHEVLKFIRGAHHRFEINEEMPRVWFKFLKDESFDTVMNRLERHIKDSKFEPTIHDLITRTDPELESRRMEIARNRWISEGNDPDAFEYKPASGD